MTTDEARALGERVRCVHRLDTELHPLHPRCAGCGGSSARIFHDLRCAISLLREESEARAARWEHGLGRRRAQVERLNTAQANIDAFVAAEAVETAVTKTRKALR